MAIINCPECNKEISDKATACPHCGCPIESVVTETIKVCPNCGSEYENYVDICPECECELETKTTQYKTEGVDFFMYILAFLIPILGFILGAIYISNRKNDDGKSLLYCSVGSILF